MIHFHSQKITRAVEGAGHTPIAEEDARGVDATGTDAETSDQRLCGDPRVTLIRSDLVTMVTAVGFICLCRRLGVTLWRACDMSCVILRILR